MNSIVTDTLVKFIDHIRINYNTNFLHFCEEQNIPGVVTTVGEFYALGYIGENQPINGTTLSSGLNMTRGAVSKIAVRFQKRGLINIEKREDNLKENYYVLTEEGNKVYQEIINHKKKTSEKSKEFIDTFTVQEQETIVRFLNGVQKYIE